MISDFTGFDFLRAALHPVSDIRRGYGFGGAAAPDIRRGYGLGDAAAPDTSVHANAIGVAATVDMAQHSTGTYMSLSQS